MPSQYRPVLLRLRQFPSTFLELLLMFTVHSLRVYASFTQCRRLTRQLCARLHSFWMASGHSTTCSFLLLVLVLFLSWSFVVLILFYLLRPEIEVHCHIADLIPLSLNVQARVGKSYQQSANTCSKSNCFQRSWCPAIFLLCLLTTHAHTHLFPLFNVTQPLQPWHIFNETFSI